MATGTRKRGYKEVIRGKVISVRLNEQEFYTLKAKGLQARRSLSALFRARIADLIGATTAGTDAAVTPDSAVKDDNGGERRLGPARPQDSEEKG